MGIGSVLLRAILDDPDEDLHRLALADWLEENGGPAAQLRGEFIRLQIARERDPDFHGSLCLPERRCANCRREARLLSPANFWEWFGPAVRGAWPGSPAVSMGRKDDGTAVCEVGHFGDSLERRHWFLTVSRGFVSAADFDGIFRWLDHAPPLLADQPIGFVRALDWTPVLHSETDRRWSYNSWSDAWVWFDGKDCWQADVNDGDWPSREEAEREMSRRLILHALDPQESLRQARARRALWADARRAIARREP